MSAPLRVLVVDDQRLVRDGIASLLGLQSGIEVAGTASDGAGAVDAAAECAPDVVLLDVRMPGMDGIAAVGALRENGVDATILMLTTFDDEEYVSAALAAGANGYLLKDLPAAQLAAAVRSAHAGVVQLDAAVARRLAAPAAQSTPAAPGRATPGLGLTPREADVVRLVAQGATNREIAAQLYLGEGTVKNHISRILTRLGVRDRTQLAVLAKDQGLIAPVERS